MYSTLCSCYIVVDRAEQFTVALIFYLEVFEEITLAVVRNYQSINQNHGFTYHVFYRMQNKDRAGEIPVGHNIR